MQSKFVNGQGTLAMVKADVNIFQQAKYLLNFTARNLPEGDTDQQGIRNASATLQRLCERFGSQYLDDKGNLAQTAAKKAVEEDVVD